jgi:TrmH family RNA methyltransferase
MGAHFKLPVLSTDWIEIRKYLSKESQAGAYKIYLADAAGGQVYTRADFTSPTALIIGGEAQGAGPQAAELMHERLHIPMPGEVESLNVAIAAAILMFEVVRQRESSITSP